MSQLFDSFPIEGRQRLAAGFDVVRGAQLLRALQASPPVPSAPPAIPIPRAGRTPHRRAA